MAGIAGIFLNRDAGESRWTTSKAPLLLDAGRCAWMEVPGLAALGRDAFSWTEGASGVAVNPEGNVWLAIDGEFFEVRGRPVRREESLPALALEEYLSRGAKFAAGFNGFFNAAVVDRSAGPAKLILAGDRWGTLPFFYFESPEVVIFSSSLGLLLRSGLVPAEPDPEAAADFFSFSYILGDSTLFRGIKSLPPATVLMRSGTTSRLERYWSFQDVKEPAFRSHAECLEALQSRFLSAVAQQTSTGPRICLGLTGGLDSRAIAGAAARIGRTITTITHTIPHARDEAIAARVSRACGLPHRWIVIRPEDLPRHIPRLIEATGGLVATLEPHVLSFLPELAEAGEVFLTGIGGEFARGYLHPKNGQVDAPADNRGLARYLLAKLSQSLGDFCDAGSLPLFRPRGHLYLPERAEEHLFQLLEELPQELTQFQKLDLVYLYQRTRKLLLVKGTMVAREKIEVRYPFLDYGLMELVWRAPPALKRQDAIHRHLISSLYPALARIPLSKTGHSLRAGLPRKLTAAALRKLRTGFYLLARRKPPRRLGLPSYDYPRWSRAELGLELKSVLTDRRSLDRGIFDPERVEVLLTEHLSGKRDWMKLIMTLASYELALRLAERDQLQTPA